MANAGSAVRVYSGASAPSVQGMDAVQAMIARLPAGLTKQLDPALSKSADELVALMREYAPEGSAFDRDPGALKRSIHKEPVDSPSGVKVKVVADALDEKGRPYPSFVEYGHKTKEGVHVPPKPFFWPAYQVMKKKIRSRAARAMTAAVKSVNTDGQ